MGKGRPSDEIASQLRRQIYTGDWSAGEPREVWRLCRELSAQRHSVRTALSVLEAEGLVESLHGVGYRATAPLRSAVFDGFGDCLSLAEGTAFVELVRQLLDFRTLQSVALAESLASHRTKIQELAHYELLDLGWEMTAPRVMELELARAAATFRDELYLELARGRFQPGNAQLGTEGGQV